MLVFMKNVRFVFSLTHMWCRLLLCHLLQARVTQGSPSSGRLGCLGPAGEVTESFCTSREGQFPSSLHTGNGLHEVRAKATDLFLLLWQLHTSSHHVGTAAVYLWPWKCFAFLTSRKSHFCDADPQHEYQNNAIQSCFTFFFPHKICNIEIKVPIFPGHCKVPVKSWLLISVPAWKAWKATCTTLRCYLSIIILCAEYQQCVNVLFLMSFVFNLCIPTVYGNTAFAIFCQKYIFSRQKCGVDLNRCTKSLKNDTQYFFLLRINFLLRIISY